MNEADLVSIVVEQDGAAAQVGTGYLIAPSTVLTASHVIAGQSSVVVERSIDGIPSRIVAQVEWSDDGLDAALLRTEKVVEPRAKLVLASRDPGVGAECETAGFPARVPGKTSIVDSSRYSGRVEQLKSDGRIEASFHSVPKDWRGISGGPVFCGKELVGVVSSQPPGFRDDDRIHAIAVTRLRPVQERLEQLGNSRLQKQRTKLVEGFERFARVRGDFIGALCRELKIEQPEELVSELERRSAEEVVLAHSRIWKSPGNIGRPFVLEALKWAIPLCRGWEASIAALSNRPEGEAACLSVGDAAGVHVPRALVDGEPVDLSAINGQQLMCIEVRQTGREAIGIDSEDTGAVRRLLHDVAERLSVPTDGLSESSIAKSVDRIIKARNKFDSLFPPPWVLVASYVDEMDSSMDSVVNGLCKLVPSLVVVVATSAEDELDGVDVFVGDTIRAMMDEKNSTQVGQGD